MCQHFRGHQSIEKAVSWDLTWVLAQISPRLLQHPYPPPPQGCIGREGASEAAPAAVRRAVGGGYRSGWGGYCRLQMPLRLAFAVGMTVAGHIGWAPWRPQMVRLQCPHLALAAPAPQLSSPSVQSANVRRSLSSRSVQQFIPRPCVRSLHSLPGLYRVMRASRSMVTPFPWCCCSWPHSATLGRALLGP